MLVANPHFDRFDFSQLVEIFSFTTTIPAGKEEDAAEWIISVFGENGKVIRKNVHMHIDAWKNRVIPKRLNVKKLTQYLNETANPTSKINHRFAEHIIKHFSAVDGKIHIDRVPDMLELAKAGCTRDDVLAIAPELLDDAVKTTRVVPMKAEHTPGSHR